jgi:hypothetical protein
MRGDFRLCERERREHVTISTLDGVRRARWDGNFVSLHIRVEFDMHITYGAQPAVVLLIR